MTHLAPRHHGPRISASVLPLWTCSVLDGLLAAGVICAADLDELGSDQLTGLAILWTRTVASGEPFDAGEALEAARVWSGPQRAAQERERRRGCAPA
jgi:hypothetical protein